MITKRSFNIKYDLADKSILKDYHATSSHSELIKYVLDGVIEGKQKAHIAYGPYGSGKSYISTILTSILQGSFMGKEMSLLVDKFSRVDSEVSLRFKKLMGIHHRYIPVIISGFEGDFDLALIRSLYSSLKKNNITIYTSGIVNTINEIIEGWKAKYSTVYDNFLIYLSRNNLDLESFIVEISDNNLDVINSFSKYFTDVSAGAELSINENENLISVFEYVLKKLSDQKIGVFVVYDEFGRLLQNIKPHDLNRFMEQLQGLAELANIGASNLSLLFIAHKPISHYFNYLDKEKRSEFSKIEKRFTVSEIRSDNATFISIATEVIKSLKKTSIKDNDIFIQARKLSKYKIFSNSLNDTEVENKIIVDCYPLHPTALFVLPRISSIFGQNERTLFTFLLDDSLFGLNGFINKSDGYYYPDYLVDYFFTTMNNSEIENNKEISIYRKSLSNIPNIFDDEFKSDAIRIYKFCLLWNITSSNGYASLTNGFISYSLGLDEELVEKCIKIFLDSKLLRNNSTKKRLEIIEASSVDLKQEIFKRIQIISLNKGLLIDTLNELNPYKVMYPNNYNNMNDMTRFARIVLNIENCPEYRVENSHYDLLIKIETKSIGIEFSKDYLSDKTIFGFMECNIEELMSLLSQVAAIDSLLSDRHFILEYRNVDLDLKYEKSLLQKKLLNYYQDLFTEKCSYFYRTSKIEISSSQDFEKMIERIIMDTFSSTVIIHNDQINMYSISKIQKSAIISVIDLLMKYKEKHKDIDFTTLFVGNKPDFLVYYSIIKSDFVEVKNRIRQHINDNETGNLSDLINIMIAPPFGIRPVITPVILMLSIIDMWKNIMFFNNDDFIAELPATYLFDVGFGIRDCKYSYSSFEFENQQLLNSVITEFGNMSEGVQNKSLSIKVCSCLYNWYLTLPVIVQLGSTISLKERYFTRSIEMAKTNPRKALDLIVNTFDEETLLEMKNSIENSFSFYLRDVEDKIKNDYGITSWTEWANSQYDAMKRSNEFIGICLEHESIIRPLAGKIDQLEIERWPSSMFEVLCTNIKNNFASINNELDTYEIRINGRIEHIFNVELSKKALNLKRNLGSLIDANKKYITKFEVEKVIYEIIEQFIK